MWQVLIGVQLEAFKITSWKFEFKTFFKVHHSSIQKVAKLVAQFFYTRGQYYKKTNYGRNERSYDHDNIVLCYKPLLRWNYNIYGQMALSYDESWETFFRSYREMFESKNLPLQWPYQFYNSSNIALSKLC